MIIENDRNGLELKMTPTMVARVEQPGAARPPSADMPYVADTAYVAYVAYVGVALAALATLLLVMRLRANRRDPAAGALRHADFEQTTPPEVVRTPSPVVAPPVVRAPAPIVAPARPAPLPSEPEAAASLPAAPAAASKPARTAVATLQDLHDLHARLADKPNPISQKGILEDHLEHFAHTSPWVLLELRAVRGHRYHLWADEEVPEFSRRFGVRPPGERDWARREDGILRDAQLCDELTASWPHDAKAVIAFWMLGSRTGDPPPLGMPLLTLGAYRDLLFVDSLRVEREFHNPSEFAPLHSL